MIKISLLAAIAVVLMYFDFPIIPAFPWLKIDLSDIPTPTYENHTFLGWYTTPTYNVNAGKLTDLTPVFKKTLTVYAWWEANI